MLGRADLSVYLLLIEQPIGDELFQCVSRCLIEQAHGMELVRCGGGFLRFTGRVFQIPEDALGQQAHFLRYGHGGAVDGALIITVDPGQIRDQEFQLRMGFPEKGDGVFEALAFVFVDLVKDVLRKQLVADAFNAVIQGNELRGTAGGAAVFTQFLLQFGCLVFDAVGVDHQNGIVEDHDDGKANEQDEFIAEQPIEKADLLAGGNGTVHQHNADKQCHQDIEAECIQRFEF